MNVAIYTRSVAPSRAEHQWQREACRKLAIALGYEVTHTYSDERRERPELHRLMADVASGDISVLLLARYDRLTRSNIENARITATLFKANVEIYAANMGTRPLNDPLTFITQVMGAMRVSDPTPDYHDAD